MYCTPPEIVPSCSLLMCTPFANKKVLLRECKRHTTHHVASAHYASGGGEYPIQSWWGVPLLSWLGGIPSSHDRGYPGYSPHHPGRGVPHPVMVGVPLVPCHHQTWDRVPPTDGEQTDIPKYKYYLPSYYVRGR